MATDDLRVVLRTVLEGHAPTSVDYGRLVHCSCVRFGTRSWDEYREHVARMQVDAVLASDWYREYGRLVGEVAWDLSRDMSGEDLLTKPDEAGMKKSRPNPYREDS